MAQHPTHVSPYDDLTKAEADEVNDMLSMEVDEIAGELGLKPDSDTLRFSEADQARIIEYCRDMVIRLRELTPEQEERVGERLGDILHFEKDNIAASLGIHPQWEGDWTDEESDRIMAECDRLYKASVIARILSSD